MKITITDITPEETKEQKPKKEKRTKVHKKRENNKIIPFIGKRKKSQTSKDTIISNKDDVVDETTQKEETKIPPYVNLRHTLPVIEDIDVNSKESVLEVVKDETDIKNKKQIVLKSMKIGVITTVLIVGTTFGMYKALSTINIDTKNPPITTTNEEYQPLLDASVEEFDAKNKERLDLKNKENDSQIVVETPEDTLSPEERIENLQAEVDRLTQELEEARAQAVAPVETPPAPVPDTSNDTTALEKELEDTKAALEASLAREEYLQSQLNKQD